MGTLKGEGLDLLFENDPLALLDLSPGEATLVEHALLGVSVGDHLLAFYRPWLDGQEVVRSERLRDLENGRAVRVAGLLVVHQSPPTAKKVHFLTIEDEAGLMDIVIHPKLYTRYAGVIREAGLLVVEGTLYGRGRC